QQQGVRADQAVVVKRVHDGGAARPGEAHQIVTETQVVVKVNDVGTEVVEDALEASLEKAVRPVGDARVFAAVDAVIRLNAAGRLAPQAAPPRARGIRDVENANVFGPVQMSREVEAVDLRSL